MELASLSRAFFITILISTTVADTPPMLSLSLDISLFALLRYITQHSSCERSRKMGLIIFTAYADDCICARDLISVDENLFAISNTAVMAIAFEEPIPFFSMSLSTVIFESSLRLFSFDEIRFL